jgi:hypothetical protein
MTLKAKAKSKPSQQTSFVLDAMATESKEGERWEKVHESIDLLYAKMEAQGKTQQQLAA